MQTEVALPEIELVSDHSQTDLRLRYFCYAALVVILIVFTAIRLHLRNMPLERDEGEYAYAGQLILQGDPPYHSAYNMKLPGTYAAYALMMAAFGQSISGIRIGMLAVLLGNTLLVFLLGRRLFGILAGTVAAAFYTILANRLSTVSLDGHATHFIVLMTLSGTLLLLRAIKTHRSVDLFGSGVFFGLAFLMKQHGILFAAFGFFFWGWNVWKRRAGWREVVSQGGILAAGVMLPYVLTCLIVWYEGVFPQFWFWTVSYGAAYEKLINWSYGWTLFRAMIPRFARPINIWVTAGFGLTAVFWSRRFREHKVFVISFALFSFLAVFPGLYFRPHYFLVMYPAVALLGGLGISAAYEYLQGRKLSRPVMLIPIALFVMSYVSALYGQRKYFFNMDARQVHREMYAGDGFPEAIAVGDYVREHTSSEDRIVVLGSEPQIYFYAQRRSATGYIYMYPLMERQKFALRMQADMEREVENAQPKMVVFVDTLTWDWKPEWDASEPHMNILIWARAFLDAHYDLTAEIQIEGASSNLWGAPCRFYIFQRK